MHRPSRIFLSTIKYALLVIALTSLAMGLASRGRDRWVTVTRSKSMPDAVLAYGWTLEAIDGELGFGTFRDDSYGEPALSQARLYTVARGDGWRWNFEDDRAIWWNRAWTTHMGPLVGYFPDWEDSGYSRTRRYIRGPAWLFSLIAGAWPALSAALGVWNRGRRKRAGREGC